MALIPVCIGSFTGWRSTTPGAIRSSGIALGRGHRTLAVEGTTEGIDDAADHFRPHRDVENPLGAADLVTLFDVVDLTHEHGTDVVVLEVEREAVDVVRELEELTHHDPVEAVDAGDSVADGDDRSHLRHIDRGFLAFDLAPDDVGDFGGFDLHIATPVR